MKLFKKMVTATAAVAVIAAGFAPMAAADGVHLIDQGTVWAKGCDATYSLDDRASSMYGKYINLGLNYITPFTGIQFEQLDNNDPTADIRYAVADDLSQYGQNVQGVGDTNGNVSLLPLEKLQYTSGQTAENLRLNLVVHETLHVLGLGHDNDEGQTVVDEIMNEMLPVTQISFGNGDLAGMEHIRAKNGCNTAGFRPPTPVTKPATPPVSAVPNWSGFASKTVIAVIPTKSVYMVGKHKTIIIKSKKIKVPARSNGTDVWVKFTSGWAKVPYIYKKSTNSIIYNEAYRLRQGIERDLLGAEMPRYIY